MLCNISMFANQSYGLPVPIVAQAVTVKVVATQKVKVTNMPTQSVNIKQKP